MKVYIDGIFDLFHKGHLESFHKSIRMGKTISDNVELVVGVINDQDAFVYKRLPIIREHDRVDIIRAIGIVDSIIFPAPLIITDEFMIENNIDLVVHGFANEADFLKQQEFFKVPISQNKFAKIDYYIKESTSDIISRCYDIHLLSLE